METHEGEHSRIFAGQGMNLKPIAEYVIIAYIVTFDVN